MSPNRKKQVGSKIIEEYWWAGGYVVYVNNRFVEGTFEQITTKLINELKKRKGE